MRLDKALSSSGFGTRTEVKALITHGKVTVAGSIIRDPAYHISNEDISGISVNGESINIKDKLYLVFNKPDGVLTAMEDKRLPNVGQFIPANLKTRKLSPVGRLDYHTTGLLIITNDGELSHRLTSPSYNIPKIYEVLYEGAPLTQKEKNEASAGITLRDKNTPVRLKPAVLEFTEHEINTARITLTEGKTHEVRRIFAQWERPVTALRRVALGTICLDDKLSEGELRELTPDEVRKLKELTGLT
ncbi:MAG: rRNA pseudouridine synthase [Clostridiales bacterium]|nr:rRNA pseudouridine synthase [Clostridiales bacterium]